MARKHILVDACVAAAYFAPSTTRSPHLRRRADALLSGMSASFQHQLLIPNFCIGEVFSVFEKYRWGGSWNPHVQTSRLTPRKYNDARSSFHAAIHNGNDLMQVDLNRYHVLCLDLIAPVNAAYRIKRNRKKKRNVVPAGTLDLLFVAMGIWLQKQLGPDNFLMATGDERLAMIVKRAQAAKLSKPIKKHLRGVARGVGLKYGADIYPTCLDLVHATGPSLGTALADWSEPW